MLKERIYSFPHLKRQWHFLSSGVFVEISEVEKQENNSPGEVKLLEYCNHGFGMHLEMIEKEGNIQFLGKDFFVEIPRLGRVKLPAFFTPGNLVLDHEAISDNSFKFRFLMEHPIFGKTFFQEGIFVEQPPDELKSIKPVSFRVEEYIGEN